MKRRDFCTTTTVAAIGLTANQAKSQPEVRKREFFEKPTEERKRKAAAAVKRNYKRVMKDSFSKLK